MPSTKELTVEQKELLARAAELETPITGMPTDVTQAPCALPAAGKASKQLNFNSMNIQAFLAEGQRERARLAQSLRNAAKAYGAIDEHSAKNVSGNGSGGVEQVIDGGGRSAPLTDTQVATLTGEPEFVNLKDAAKQIAAPDQKASLRPFADGWTAHGKAVKNSMERFRPFKSWTGQAATVAQQSLDQQRQWLSHMAELCDTLSKQAMYLYDLQDWTYSEHPKLPEIEQLETLHAAYKNNPDAQKKIMETYKQMQQRSEHVITHHRQRADIPVINPPKPPQALEIKDQGPKDLLPEWVKQVGDMTGLNGLGPQGGPMSAPGGSPSPSVSMPTTPGTATMSPAMSTGMPDFGGGSPSMSPAGVSGSLGAGVGAPSMAVAPAGAGVGTAPSIPGGPGGYGGGGMGGGMPMMGGMGQGTGGAGAKGGGKGLEDEKPLYTAAKTWTEGVIGNRPRPVPPVPVKA